MAASFTGNYKILVTRMPREIRHLILVETTLTSKVNQRLKHLARKLFPHIKLTGLQLLIQRRVLLVNNLVA